MALAWPAIACAAHAADAPLTDRIRALEADGRAHPRAAADALEALLPSAGASTAERAELLTVEGVTLATASLDDDARRQADRLEAWGRDAGRPHARLAAAAAQLIRARILVRSGDLLQADALLRTAIAALPADVSPVDRFRFVSANAYAATEAGRVVDALRLNHEAVRLADRQDALWRQSEARSALASSYHGTKEDDRARSTAADAVALAERGEDWVSLARAHNAEAIAADGLRDLAGERRAFEAAIQCARRAESKVDEVRYLANIADFFLQTADYQTALSYAERALPLARELHDRNTEIVALSNIGLAQISLHQRALGMRNVLRTLELEKARGSAIGVADGWLGLGEYLERAGFLADAVGAYHTHRRLITDVLRADEQKAIVALQEQFDTDSRARALELLNRDNALKAEQLRRGDLLQRLGLLLTVAVLLSFVAVAMLYRRVRQTNRLLAGSNERLKLQGERDPLTGLANRRHVQALLPSLAPGGLLRASVYLIDVDHFKRINDRHGHGVGDAVLIEVGRRLRSMLRDVDLIVRWGGEEFLVVVQGLSRGDVDALAQRLLDALGDGPVQTGDVAVPVTASIGFATFPIGPHALGVSCERAVGLVDAAMYRAKREGRNRAIGVDCTGGPDAAALDAATADIDAAAADGRVVLTCFAGRGAATGVAAGPWSALQTAAA